MIYLLWPTIRPEAMKDTYAHWISAAAHPENVRLKLAVNTDEDRQALLSFPDVTVVGTHRRGGAYPSYVLFKSLSAELGDIVVLGTDDSFAPPLWDEWLAEQFLGQDDAIIVNDAGQFGACVTQPIMTFGCVLRLNRIVLHPSYYHFYADAELFANLTELGLVRDLRGSGGLVFDHRNWAWNKRPKDQYDHFNCERWKHDEEMFHARMQMPVEERLKVDEGELAALTS